MTVTYHGSKPVLLPSAIVFDTAVAFLDRYRPPRVARCRHRTVTPSRSNRGGFRTSRIARFAVDRTLRRVARGSTRGSSPSRPSSLSAVSVFQRSVRPLATDASRRSSRLRLTGVRTPPIVDSGPRCATKASLCSGRGVAMRRR